MTGTPRDRKWLEELFRREHPKVLAYARRRTFDEADDVVAEVFLTAWKNRHRIPEPELPWLLRAASNHVLHARRAEARRARLVDRVELRPDVVSDPAQHIADADSAHEAIRKALTRLAPRDAELMRLLAWEELSLVEAAYVLGCTPVAARVRLHRARRRLREELHTREHAVTPTLDCEATA